MITSLAGTSSGRPPSLISCFICSIRFLSTPSNDTTRASAIASLLRGLSQLYAQEGYGGSVLRAKLGEHAVAVGADQPVRVGARAVHDTDRARSELLELPDPLHVRVRIGRHDRHRLELRVRHLLAVPAD